MSGDTHPRRRGDASGDEQSADGSHDERRGGMDRRDYLRAIGTGAALGAVGVGAAGVAASDPSDAHYHNPIGPRGFGDVTTTRTDDGTWYVYGTGMPIARSETLVDWTPMGHVLSEDDVGWRTNPDAGLWAPNVNRWNGQYYLYYSYSTWGSQNNPGIGLATADSPEGPFTDQGPVFRAEDLGMTNAIDGTMVVVDGTPYMIWGSFFGIYGVELTPDGRDYVPGTTFHLAGDNKEGAMTVRENGYWYLFYSTGHCCDGADSTYAVEVGRADSFFGPYYTRDGRDLRNVDAHHGGTTVLSGTDQFIGPGHNTAVRDDDGQWWMLYHVEATAEQDGRVMMLDPITWDDQDWPVVGCDGTPSSRQPTPWNDDEICGSTRSTPDPGTETPTPTPAPNRVTDLPGAETVAPGRYRLINVNSGLALEVANGDGADGTNVQQGTDGGAAHQQWDLRHRGDGRYELLAVHSGKALDVSEGSTANGANVVQWSPDGADSQRWYVDPLGDGTYRLVAAHSGLALEVFEYATADGANVVQYEWNEGDWQRWRLEPVDDGGPPAVGDNENAPTDPDGDGHYEDVNGNGEADYADVVDYFEHMDEPAMTDHVDAYDYNGNGQIDYADLVDLFEQV